MKVVPRLFRPFVMERPFFLESVKTPAFKVGRLDAERGFSSELEKIRTQLRYVLRCR